MCGRFTLRAPLNRVLGEFAVRAGPQIAPRYNIAPTQLSPVVRWNSGERCRELVNLRWGLVPSWAEDPALGTRMINARAESVATRPAFRSAFRHRRCLIAADGYYEWKKTGARKQPYFIHRADDGPFGIAGLWESWHGVSEKESEPQPLETFTIITTDANELTRPIHNRMPVILRPEDYALWLDPQVRERDQLEPLLMPYGAPDMVAQPISTYVNNPKNEGPRCTETVGN